MMTKVKLNTKDYIFEYQNLELTNAYVKYDFKETISIPSGVSTNYIVMSLYAQNKKEDYTLELSLKLSKPEFKKLDNKFINVNDKVKRIELYEPNMTRTPDLNLSNVDELYSNPSNVWIKRNDDNSYYVKISLPEYNLFVLFKVKIAL